MEIEKVEKIVTNLYHKNKNIIQTRSLKQALSYRLVLKKVNRVIKINQKDWFKKQKMILRNTFSS